MQLTILFRVEELQWPDNEVLGYLVLNGLVGTVLSDYFWLLAVLLTSPVRIRLMQHSVSFTLFAWMRE